MPFFHGDVLADGSVYCAAWDAFLEWRAFVAAVPFLDHVTRYERRVEWLQRNKRHAGTARRNALALMFFGTRAEPCGLLDWRKRRALLVERKSAGQCVRCGVPLPPDGHAHWTCRGCGL
jgi:hypothetical protein